MVFLHDAPDMLRLGIVAASGVDVTRPSAEIDQRLEAVVRERAQGLSSETDAFRKDVRDVFRNGSYKPTGRGKPASEYLVRAAAGDGFPRINAVVDACNYLSLKTLYPISIWDPDRVGSRIFRFRLGAAGETYVFNPGGQEVALEDLIVGCVCADEGDPGEPIVNAVKDSQRTKTSDNTSRVVAAIYAPRRESPVQKLADTCAEFAHLLSDPSVGGAAIHGCLDPGQRADFRLP
jgi:DNA/RNA-binding domain of Phe-tRNA-synthetase-like protein